ncbi:MAG: L-histidine N(alpha)-methyltransferase [Alphaproteobacteria bacterium]|jgi:dimethylhistidine N-methyltransferase|nr:L-histidine N(alpha)-methyltransferase [Alphaproteobacteria bacterium]
MNLPIQQLDAADVADREQFRNAVLAGLGTRPKAIPARFLYDARGSALFDAICELPEYYLTRTETAILAANAAEISRNAGPHCTLIEFGSGSSVKSRLLLDAMPTLNAYVPIDISREHLDGTVARLRSDYPALRVEAVCADYMTLEHLPDTINGARRIGFFPGSTIGNLTPEEATSFLRRVRRLLGDGGALILGVDLKKDSRRLHDAYNDAAGITAQFTLNLLRRMNRELDGSFDLAAFAHEAFYNPSESRIEIYLRSLLNQTVSVSGRRLAFEKGELVHTEYSYKYDSASLAALAARGGFAVDRTWTDAEGLFAVAWLKASA